MQTAVPTNYVLHGINLKNSCSLERERSSYNLFAMILKTLLNELVRTVDVSASRTFQTVSVSIELYAEIRFTLAASSAEIGFNLAISTRSGVQYRLLIASNTVGLR